MMSVNYRTIKLDNLAKKKNAKLWKIVTNHLYNNKYEFDCLLLDIDSGDPQSVQVHS